MSSQYASLQSGTGSRHKFPFLIVPVSPNTTATTSTFTTVPEDNDSCLVRKQHNDGKALHSPPHSCPSSQNQDLPVSNPSDNYNKIKRTVGKDNCKRSAALQKKLNAHFSPEVTYPTLLQTFSAHDQLRRPARLLYPSPSSTCILDRQEADDIEPLSILYNGVRITEKNYQDLLRPPNISKNQSVEPNRSLNPCSKPEDFAQPLPQPVSLKSRTDRNFDKWKRSIPEAVGDCYKDSNFVAKSPPALQLQVDDLTRQLRVRDVEITNLRDALAQVKKLTNSNSLTPSSCCQSLKKGLAKVEKHLEHLEGKVDFYDEDVVRRTFEMAGLPIKSQNDLTDIELDNSSSPLLVSPDFDRIIRTTRELNSLVGSNSMELCYNSGGATFKQTDAVMLILYKNGLILDDAPDTLKRFSSPSTHQFLQDIHDGYFPSELQTKYPNGVTLIVKDKRFVVYTKEGGCFAGKGIKLFEPYRKPAIPKFLPGMKYEAVKSATLDKIISKESLSSSSASLKSHSCYEELPEFVPKDLRQFHNKRSGMKNVITLKLKNLVTGGLYKLRTSIGSTVGDLIEHLENHLNEDKSESDDETGMNRKYELINILPFGSFSILGCTFKDYGITSNTLLYFRPL